MDVLIMESLGESNVAPCRKWLLLELLLSFQGKLFATENTVFIICCRKRLHIFNGAR